MISLLLMVPPVQKLDLVFLTKGFVSKRTSIVSKKDAYVRGRSSLQLQLPCDLSCSAEDSWGMVASEES